jgi:GT2 family glycosyltransferase
MPDSGNASQTDDIAPEALDLLPASVSESSLIEGFFDGIEDAGWVAGWVRPLSGNDTITLAVAIDGALVAEIWADQFRDDLLRPDGSGGSCAFWFDIPEEFLDGEPHEVDILVAETGERLRGAPRTFAISQFKPAGSRDRYNIIPNADFLEWPAGLVVQPTERFVEPFTGWYFDFRKGTQPVVRFSADKPNDVALKPTEYALRVSVESGGTDGFMRLIVPLDVTAPDIVRHRFSLGLRRPVSATDDSLHIPEIFLGTVNNASVTRIAAVRRNLRPRGTQRVVNIPAVNQPELFAGIDPEEVIALVFDFRGNGSLLLFTPDLSIAGSLKDEPLDILGEFEDQYIRDQVSSLILSPIWRPRQLATAPLIPGEQPIPAAARTTSRGHSAVPFIQIVVPVFNAAADVEDLLRSILRSTDSPFEILLFDDGSAEFAQLRISRWEALDPRIRYHQHRENIGYTRNINIAIQSTVSDYVVLINSDTVVAPGWLRKLYQVIVLDPDTAAVGPLSNAASWQSVPYTKSSTGDWVVNEFPEELTTEKIDALVEQASDGVYPAFPLLNGFCTLFRKSALEQVGFFDDESFPKGYGEENDLCLRLGKAGFKLRVATDTYVQHKKSKSFGNEQRKDLSKKANTILRGKHPSVTFSEIEEVMRTDPSVNHTRQHLSRALGIESTI